MTPQNFAIERARQKDVVGKLRLARALRARVDLAKGFADYVERLSVILIAWHVCRGWDCPRPISYWLDVNGQGQALPLQSFETIDTFTREIHLFTADSRCGQFNSFVNLYVAGATTKIPG